MNILSPFKDDGEQSEFYQTQSSKQSTRTSSHDNHLWTSLNILVFRPDKPIIMRLFIHVNPHRQVHPYLPLPRINASFQNSYPIQRPLVDTLFIGYPPPQPVFLRSHFRQHSYLIFVYQRITTFLRPCRYNPGFDGFSLSRRPSSVYQ